MIPLKLISNVLTLKYNVCNQMALPCTKATLTGGVALPQTALKDPVNGMQECFS